MPASQTAKYRSTLDAMRNGTLKTGSTAGGGVMVNVNNYTDSDVSVKKNKNGELELTNIEEGDSPDEIPPILH